MYSLLSSNSQAEYSIDSFTNIYTSATTTMTLGSLEATPLASLAEMQGTSAQFSFRVTYNTMVLGSFQKDMTMQLVSADNRWSIVWTPSLIFPEMAGGNTLSLEVVSPSRANIYDRNGLSLVTANASTMTIQAVPGEINPDFEPQMLDLLSRVLRMPAGQIKNNYAGFPPDNLVALGDTDIETFQANSAALQSYPGLRFAEKTGRRYFNTLAPHVMGYTSYITAEQLEAYKGFGYQGDEIIGQTGLEKWGEQYLAGTRGGTLSAYTATGEFYAEIASKESVPAQSLYTTIDRNLQAIVQDTMQDAYLAGANTWAPQAGGMAIVVLDVNSGDVLAMASYPYYDPNVLSPVNSHPLSTPQYLSDLFNNPLKPFLNRATQGIYPPGSVFKIVTTAAALESGVLQPNTLYSCSGVWGGLGANNLRYDWLEEGHGDIEFRQALTASCNPYFYEAGLLTGQKDYAIIPATARQFGFGQQLNNQIDEESGLVPDPEWLKATRGEDWSLADSVNIAIGQGDLQVSPLQVATMVATIANGGTVYRPHFVTKIGLLGEDPTVTFQPETLNRLSVSPEHIAMIQESMRQVVIDPILGTAEWRLGNIQVPVAGKTGTAQVSQAEAPPIAWFAGYAPYDDPQIAIVVMVENGGQGSGVAAPIFRRVVERYFGLPPLDWPGDWFDPELFEFVKNDIGE
jgi:penicillin-binding protein 2